ncbi:glycosyltransferase family 4 protein [Candidatus Nomurabacteria bacterium]|nr:glycosyltransferase family 4 protein [Candidatus Nomurabacteria bacterium]
MNKLQYLIKKTLWSFKNYGFKKTLHIVKNWLTVPSMRKENRLNPKMRYDNVDFLLKKIDFRKNYLYGDRKSRLSPDSIHLSWILSPFHIGSGGHQTIFRFIKFLSERGYKNVLYITDGHNFSSEKEAAQMIYEQFFPIQDLDVRFLKEEELVNGRAVIDDTDFVIATRYNTAYYAALINNCIKRFYFVQDLEPIFFPMGYNYILAENTYRLGMHAICASPWLAQQMKKYNLETDNFYLGYDPEVYFNRNLAREKGTVVFYARYQSERRAVELGMLALEIAAQKVPDMKAILYGANDNLSGYDFPFENKGVIKYDEMADIFANAEIGLSFSLTNYGLTPTEMMASGLPVIELKGENTENVFTHVENVLLADPNPNAVADAIVRLLSDEALRAKLSSGGLAFVEDKSWNSIWAGLEPMWQREILSLGR